MYNKSKTGNSPMYIIVICLILTFIAAMTLSILGVYGAGNVSPPSLEESSEDKSVFDGDGHALEDGKVHPMPEKMVFTSSALATAGNAGIVMLTATISPDTATDKSVSWYAEWVNSDSEWANGKSITEYLNVFPESDGAATAEVICLQPFGEQVKIRVVSRDNPEATAECVVDFGQKVDEVFVSIGNEISVGMLPVDFGKPVDIRWELNMRGEGPGGLISVNYESGNVYTLADEFEAELNILASGAVKTPGSSLGEERHLINDMEMNFLDETLNFDYSGFELLGLFYMKDRSSDYVFAEKSTEENIECFKRFSGIPALNLRLTLNGKYGSYVFWGKLNIVGYTNHASVKSVTLDSSTLTV